MMETHLPAFMQRLVKSRQAMNEEQAQACMDVVRQAWAQLEQGQPDPESLSQLCLALCIAQLRYVQIEHRTPGLADDDKAAPHLIDARQAIDAVCDRQACTGTWSVLPEEREAIEDALALIDAVYRASSPAQIEQCRVTLYRLRLAGNRKKESAKRLKKSKPTSKRA